MKNINLFGDQTPDNTKKIVIRTIQARYHSEVVREDAPEWVSARYTAPSQIRELFKDLADEAKEHFIVLHLDGKNRINCVDRVSTGSLNQCVVHPREVFKTACLSNAASLILVHNHPTGDPTPSPEDINITRRLKEAGDIMGIKILDHIIIGDDYHSFVESGLL